MYQLITLPTLPDIIPSWLYHLSVDWLPNLKLKVNKGSHIRLSHWLYTPTSSSRSPIGSLWAWISPASKSWSPSGVTYSSLTEVSLWTVEKELINLFYILKSKFWAIELILSYGKHKLHNLLSCSSHISC